MPPGEGARELYYVLGSAARARALTKWKALVSPKASVSAAAWSPGGRVEGESEAEGGKDTRCVLLLELVSLRMPPS